MPPPPLPPPTQVPFLYRYGAADTLERLEPLIVQHQLYIPSAENFNDLRDVRPRVAEKTTEEWIAYLTSQPQRTPLPPDLAALDGQAEDILAEMGSAAIHEFATQQWHARMANHRIYCLCKRWDNLSMWEWYAGKQTGYCLEFARTGPFVDVRDVAYEPPPPYDLTDLSHATNSWFFYKHPDWSNEEEARLVLARKQSGPWFLIEPSLLTRIILGEDMTEANAARVREMARRRVPALPVRTAMWDAIRSELVLA